MKSKNSHHARVDSTRKISDAEFVVRSLSFLRTRETCVASKSTSVLRCQGFRDASFD
jgi:hypothetical protein